MGDYTGRWMVIVGVKEDQHNFAKEVLTNVLIPKYPAQRWNMVMYTNYDPQKPNDYKYLLIGFTTATGPKGRDEAHKIGMAIIFKHLPKDRGFFYWTKEEKLARKTNLQNTERVA